MSDSAAGCYNPHECAMEALQQVRQISPKWNPLSQELPPDSLSLTPSRKIRNQLAKINNEAITFDPSVTCKGNLANAFRVFINPHLMSNLPALRRPARGRNPISQKITIYTDGACLNNGKRNAICRSGIWAGHGSPLNKAFRVPGDMQSNQIGEITAIIIAVMAVPLSQPLEIVSDSRYAIEGLTTHLQSWEDQGWIGIKNAHFFQKAAFLLHRRTAPTTFKWVKGHEGVEGNEQSDRLAKEGANKPLPDLLDLTVPDVFNVQGAKVTSLTQSTAYKGICESKTPPTRQTSSDNIRLTMEAIEHYTGIAETEAAIWLSIRSAPIRPKISQFLFKSLHGVYMIGGYWTHIPAIADRSLCTTCGVTESMDHILIHCRSTPMQLIWQLAKDTWPHANIPWPEISLGIILGCRCLTVPPEANQEQHQGNAHLRGASCLLRILISESAHLIWALQCDRVIQEKVHNHLEIRNKWLNAIDKRLTDDKITASTIKRNKGFTTLVVNTWEHVLSKDGALPNSWINVHEVLVGSRSRRP